MLRKGFRAKLTKASIRKIDSSFLPAAIRFVAPDPYNRSRIVLHSTQERNESTEMSEVQPHGTVRDTKHC